MASIGEMSAVAAASRRGAFDQELALHGEHRLAAGEPPNREALAAEPGHAGALCYLGLLRLQQDRTDEAIVLLRQAIERDSQTAEAHHHLGVALQRLGEHPEALACQNAALAL